MSERQPFGGLTDGEMEHLVERISKRVMTDFYAEVGKNVVRKGLVWAGMLGVALAIFFGFVKGVQK
jgi:hypothetical protein